MVELRKFIGRQRNPLLHRIEFYRRAQQPGETFDGWYTSLRELFHACNFFGLDVCSTCSRRMCQTCQQTFQAHTDEIQQDCIVTGILQDDVRHKLLAMKDLTLVTCVDLCRTEEAASHTLSRIPSQAAGDASVSAVSSSYKKQKGMASKQTRAHAAKDSKSGSKPSRDKCPNCPSAWCHPIILIEKKRPHLLAQPPFPPTDSLSYTTASCSHPYCLCSRRCTRPDISCLYCPWCTCPSTACTTPQSSPSAAECPV
eukprot:scpid74289/ scgid20605/ 